MAERIAFAETTQGAQANYKQVINAPLMPGRWPRECAHFFSGPFLGSIKPKMKITVERSPQPTPRRAGRGAPASRRDFESNGGTFYVLASASRRPCTGARLNFSSFARAS